MGELHTVFAALKTIRKYINSKGTDIRLSKAGIYGTNTVKQIDGSYRLRGTETHVIVFPFYKW